VAVASPAPYRTLTGGAVEAAAVDLLARMAGGRPPMLHKAFPGTGAACTAVAARLAGSVPAAVCRPVAEERPVIIGHPSGLMAARARVRGGPPWVVEQAGYSRTARRLMEGTVFVRAAVLRPAGASETGAPARR
jgi:2-methylaconitate cis-trans-isomerase PrpF